MNRKFILGGVIIMAWAAVLGIAKAVLAPALGAATVMQLQGADPSYVASMLFVSVLGIGSVLLTLMFAYALYLVARSK